VRLVVGAQLDADAIQRVMREILAAHGVAALDGLDELVGRGGQVGNHHVARAPVLPHRAREDHGAVVHAPVAMEFGTAEFGKHGLLAFQQVQRLAEPPRPPRVVAGHAQGEAEFAMAAQAHFPVGLERASRSAESKATSRFTAQSMMVRMPE
jgi:hypothetical protein